MFFAVKPKVVNQEQPQEPPMPQESKIREVVTYAIIGIWLAVTLGYAFGYVTVDVPLLGSMVGIVVGYLYGKERAANEFKAYSNSTRPVQDTPTQSAA